MPSFKFQAAILCFRAPSGMYKKTIKARMGEREREASEANSVVHSSKEK